MRETGRPFGEKKGLVLFFLILLIEEVDAFSGESKFVHYFIAKMNIKKTSEKVVMTVIYAYF